MTLIFTNKCKLSTDKFKTSHGLGMYAMGIYEVCDFKWVTEASGHHWKSS